MKILPVRRRYVTYRHHSRKSIDNSSALLGFKKLFVLASMSGLVLFSSFAFDPGRGAAAFNANRLMDDYIFENVGSMNEDQIQNFLNGFPNSCIKNLNAPEPLGWSSSANAYQYGGNVRAARVIYRSAQIYGINPQVLLATMQKEQSLVAGGGGVCSQSWRYDVAMGYDCPDSGACPAHESSRGFSAQLIKAAWLLRFSQQRSYGNTSWGDPGDSNITYSGYMTAGNRARVAGGSSATYDGWATIDGQAVHMDNGTTASLYRYTPHFHGNQNFVAIFESWFGPTVGEGFSRVISDNGDPRQWLVYGSIRQYIPDSQTIHAWNLQDTPLITMRASQLESIPIGPTLGRLMILNVGPSTLYFVDGGKHYKVPWSELYATWNFQGQVISSVPPGLFTQTSDSGDLAFSIKNPGNATTYMVDGGYNGQTVLRPYQNSTVHEAWEGSAAYYTAVSADYFDSIDNAIGGTLTGTRVTSNGTVYEIVGGRKYNLPNNMAPLFPSTETAISAVAATRFPPAGYGNITQIVKTANGPTYLIDNGTKHQILSAGALSAWSVPGQDISYVTDAFLSLIPNGANVGWFMAEAGGQLYYVDKYKTAVTSELDSAYRNASPVYTASTALMAIYPEARGLTGYIRKASSPQVYMVDNSGKRRALEWPSKIEAWGGYQAGVTVLSDYIVDSMPIVASPWLYVNDGTSNYYIDGGKKWTISSDVKSEWGFGTAQVINDGTLSRLPTATLDTKLRQPNGAYVMIRGQDAYATADVNVAKLWGIDDAPLMSNDVIPNTHPDYRQLYRFAKSNVPGDNRMFLIDNGNWHSIVTTQLLNLGGSDRWLTSIDPAFAPNSITAWPGVVIKSDNGTHYVIDGGNKRPFPSATVRNQWTNNGSLTVPTVSNAFLTLLPDHGNIERSIKGSPDMIYSAENGKKRHILTGDTYYSSYAPHAIVSDRLLDTMENGTPIP